MYKKTLSLLTGLLAFVLLAGLAVPSRAAGPGRVYFSGNVTMPDGTRLKVYVSGSIRATGEAFGNIALIGPSNRLMCYMKSGSFISSTAASVYGNLTYNGVPAQVRIDLAKNGATAMVGWRVVGHDETVLWTSGENADGSILLKNMIGISFMFPPS